MNDRFHRAAIDGLLDLLKQATKKDLNAPDDDGMTPTLWAAYHGNLDALRLCCSRGGDPDRCDYTGNSALHFAAAKGSTHCVSFLVSFGANIWQMDNDFHTPMDMAGIREKIDCVRYLDGIIAKQQSLDNKMVKKFQEKAKKDAEKRREKYEKMQLDQQKKLNKLHRNIHDSEELEKKSWMFGTKSRKKPTNQYQSVRSNNSQVPMTFSQATINSSRNITDVKKKAKQKKTSSSSHSGSEPGFKISEGDQRTVRSIMGVQSQEISSVMYMPSDAMSNGARSEPNGSSKRKMLRNIFPQDDVADSNSAVHPFRGTIALRTNYQSSSAWYSAIQDNPPADVPNDSIVPSFGKPDMKDSFITGNNAYTDNGYDISDDISDNDDLDSLNGLPEATPLDTFLASLSLSEYSALFKEEKMDMEALLLCSSDELKEMGLPLGPRKKILSGLEERSAVIHSPREMELTKF